MKSDELTLHASCLWVNAAAIAFSAGRVIKVRRDIGFSGYYNPASFVCKTLLCFINKKSPKDETTARVIHHIHIG